MRSLGRYWISLAMVATLTLGGCSSGSTGDGIVEQQPPRLGTVVFDMGHGEIFSADDTTELGQSGAIEVIKAAGFDVIVNSDVITPEDLAEASGLILAGPMVPLKDEEYAAITAFAERGGTVLLTIHVPFPVLKVPAHWGLPVGTEIMMGQGPLANPTQPSIFGADRIAADALTEGVSTVVVVSGWPVVAATSEARIVVATGETTWLSAAGDQQPVPPEGTQFASYGVVGTARLGKGQIVVCGDDAVFANLALGQGDNRQLLHNIIRAMSMAAEV